MIFYLDIWLLPAIAACSSSYLVCLIWERFRPATAPSGQIEALLSGLSFIMGAASAYFRHDLYNPGIESNVIIMFIVGASSTYFWLLLRKYLPGMRRRKTPGSSSY